MRKDNKRKNAQQSNYNLNIAANKTKLESIKYDYGSRKTQTRSYKDRLKNASKQPEKFEDQYKHIIEGRKRMTSADESKNSKRNKVIDDSDDDSTYTYAVGERVKDLVIQKPNLKQSAKKIDPINKQIAFDFINKKKEKLVKTFKFKIIDNSKSVILDTYEFNKIIDKPIIPLELITEMLNKMKLNISYQEIKLVQLSTIGVFMSLVNDSEDIKDLLTQYHEKKIYLCFYVINQIDVVDLSWDNGSIKTVAIHVVKEVPEKIIIYNIFDDVKFIFPIISFSESDVNSFSTLKVLIYEKLKTIQGIKYTAEHRDKSKIFITYSDYQLFPA
jgi:hypothetical protein